MVRKIFPNFEEEFEGKPLYETLLAPTRLYYKDIHKVLEEVPFAVLRTSREADCMRMFRESFEGFEAAIDESKIKVPTVMLELEKRGNIDRKEMHGTFNMGVGMVLVTDENHVDKILDLLEDAYVVGEITEGSEKITLKF